MSIAPTKGTRKYQYSTARTTQLYFEPILDMASILQPNEDESVVPPTPGFLKYLSIIESHAAHDTNSVLRNPLGFLYPLYEWREITRRIRYDTQGK
jgi:hypothetical protein